MKSGALEASSNYLFEPFNERGSPERLLLLAVLERAILDFVGNDSREAAQANTWIFGEGDCSGADDVGESIAAELHASEASAEAFSFAWVCKELDLDCARIAAMIKAMPKRGSHRVAPWYFQKDGYASKETAGLAVNSEER